MMGGGFGGCTINIVKSSEVDLFIEQTRKAYLKTFKIDLPSYIVQVKDGSSIIQL
jgi:galactokinase